MKIPALSSFARVGLAASVLLCASPVHAEEIRAILVQENTKTTEDTVRFIAGVEEGDDWDDTMANTVQTRLESCGLFKNVRVYTEPHPKGGLRLVLLAYDKHSWVIAPTFYNQPTNRGFGVGFGENNLFGQNKKLLLYGQLATGDSFFVGAYVDPSIARTRFEWHVDTYLANQRIIEYEAPTEFAKQPRPIRQSKLRYLNVGTKLGVSLFRSFKLQARIRGARVFYDDNVFLLGDATEADVGVNPGDDIPVPGKEGWDFSYEGILKFDRRANWNGITSGNRLQFNYERSITDISDFDYWYAQAGFEIARRILSRHNFILKGTVGISENLPFQHEYTNGGTQLRGYKNAMFRGDTHARANAEYSVPLFTVFGVTLRALTFFDSTYTTFTNTDQNEMDGTRNYLPGHDDAGLSPFKNSVGGGIRMYMKQIVLPLLGLDFGYGLEGGGYEIYFAVGITDF